MAWRNGASFSRSFLNAARSPSVRTSTTTAFRRPPSPLLPTAPRSATRLFTNPRTIGVLGCVQSLMPVHAVMADARLTSHLSADVRAFCELSQGTPR